VTEIPKTLLCWEQIDGEVPAVWRGMLHQDHDTSLFVISHHKVRDGEWKFALKGAVIPDHEEPILCADMMEAEDIANRRLYSWLLKRLRDLALTSVTNLILRERINQVDHGFTKKHDDIHTLGQITQGAICYADTALMMTSRGIDKLPPCFNHKDWPWEKGSFKGSTPIRMLVKAAAMLVAEIERLQRLESQAGREGS
jgi:hypothetical protein